MKDVKLEQIMEQRPSAIRNTLSISLLRIIAWILSTGFFIVTIVFVFKLKFVLRAVGIDTEANGESYRMVGVISFVISVVFGIIVRLCKMITKRNLFILDILNWYDDRIVVIAEPKTQMGETQQTQA